MVQHYSILSWSLMLGAVLSSALASNTLASNSRWTVNTEVAHHQRIRYPRCVAIPNSMTLCSSHLNYTSMRMPNLLGHDTVADAIRFADQWLPVVQARCHKDTQVFLCAMFAPICITELIELPIYPCKPFCRQIREACEDDLIAWGYKWPHYFDCDSFPDRNEMCVTPDVRKTSGMSTAPAGTTRYYADSRPPSTTPQRVMTWPPDKCEVCRATDTITREFVTSEYCNAPFVLRARVKSAKYLQNGNMRIKARTKNLVGFKITDILDFRKLVGKTFYMLIPNAKNCSCELHPKGTYLFYGIDVTSEGIWVKHMIPYTNTYKKWFQKTSC